MKLRRGNRKTGVIPAQPQKVREYFIALPLAQVMSQVPQLHKLKTYLQAQHMLVNLPER